MHHRHPWLRRTLAVITLARGRANKRAKRRGKR